MPKVRLGTPTREEILDERISHLTERIFGPEEQRVNIRMMSQRTRIPESTLKCARSRLGSASTRNLMIMLQDRKVSGEELRQILSLK